MCTLSFVQNPSFGFQLIFNRDESPQRQKAKQVFKDDRRLFPVDPISNGSWITLTSKGLVFALINGSQNGHLKFDGPSESRKSRGKIVLDCGEFESVEKAMQSLVKKDLTSFDAFRLIGIDCETNLFLGDYDRKKFNFNKLNVTSALFVSSSFNEVEVKKFREEKFNLEIKSGVKSDRMKQLHRLHASSANEIDKKGAYGFCLHRADAQTVSQTIINLSLVEGKKFYNFNYDPLPPCESENKCINYSGFLDSF